MLTVLQTDKGAMLLIWLALAWIIGIIATDLVSLPAMVLWGVAAMGLASVVLFWQHRVGRLLGLALLALALGGVRYEPTDHLRDDVTIWQLAGHDTVVVQGVVAKEPTWSEAGQRVTLQTNMARTGEAVGAVSGLLLLDLPPYPTYRYGQVLVVEGQIREPPPARKPGAFDYRDYLARNQVFALMRDPLVQVAAEPSGNPVLVALRTFRIHCYRVVLRALPEPQASVAAGMLLGLKASIADAVYQTFQRSGITHVLVISGWHLSLVASLMTGIAARLHLRKQRAFWFSLSAIWLYALFVGATATVLRAATMASLVVLANATERQTESWTLLLAACWLLSLWNPHILWDLGFQLSVLATASLMAFHKPIRAWFERSAFFRWSGVAWAGDALSITLAAQVLVLPLLMFHFGNISLISPLANVALVPVVPPAMLFGGIALLITLLGDIVWFAGVLEEVAGLAWMVAWLPLFWLTEGARWMATIPWATMRLPTFPLWLLLSYYGSIASWWFWKRNKGETNA